MKKLSLLVTPSIIICLVFTVSCISREVPVTETYYETEYKTEYKTETYTETEDVVVNTSEGKMYLTAITNWHANIYFTTAGSGAGGTYYYGYEIDTSKHTRSQVKVIASSATPVYIGVYDLTGVGQVPPMPTTLANWRENDPKTGGLWMTPEEQTWLDNLNAIMTNPERVLGSSGPGDEISFDAKGIKEFAILANTWNVHPISSVQLVWSNDITEEQTVTKEKQVPYEVPVQVEKQRTVMQTKKVPFWEAIFH
jgi:hypothetical protein